MLGLGLTTLALALTLTRCANGPRLQLHFHRLYYERFYSTEEHCRYRYPG